MRLIEYGNGILMDSYSLTKITDTVLCVFCGCKEGRSVVLMSEIKKTDEILLRSI